MMTFCYESPRDLSLHGEFGYRFDSHYYKASVSEVAWLLRMCRVVFAPKNRYFFADGNVSKYRINITGIFS